MPRTMLSVHLILLAGQLCFASLPIAGRLALGHVPPAVIPLVRTVGGALVFAAIAWQRGVLRVERRDVPFVALCALLGTVINQELFIHGLARSTATNAVLLGTTAPVFTALTALALRREPVRSRRLIGTAIAFGGVAALVGAEKLSTSSDHLAGSAMVLINAMSYGSFLVIVRPLAEKYDPFALLALMFIAAVPMVTPFGVHALVTGPELVRDDYLALGFLVLVPTVGAYGFVQTGLRRAESSLVAVYMYLQPVFVALGAMAILDEEIGLRTVLGGAVVLFGVWLAARSRP